MGQIPLEPDRVFWEANFVCDKGAKPNLGEIGIRSDNDLRQGPPMRFDWDFGWDFVEKIVGLI